MSRPHLKERVIATGLMSLYRKPAPSDGVGANGMKCWQKMQAAKKQTAGTDIPENVGCVAN